MKKYFFSLFIILGMVCNAHGQTQMRTIAEASNYESTSLYADVMKFIENLDKSSPYIRTENIAVSEEGRKIPLVIIANPMPKTPKDLVNDQRLVIYLQGNIHAGEVEGKEALLMYMRDLRNRKDISLLKDVILLVCPIFNADGNEKISVKNRTNQKGPINGVGVRYNGSFLDLNRDAMKIESPEMKGLLTNVLNKWDPAVVLDCHTTNGVYHQEPVTFSWMANPNGDRNLINYMRDKMMPEVSKNLFEKHKVENTFYGEFIDMGNMDSGYVSYAHEPRYLVNYIGIRNRLAILNENYVGADFKSRVEGAYGLIHSIVDYVVANKKEIKTLLKDADDKVLTRWNNSEVSDMYSFDYRVVPTPVPVTVKTYEVVRDTNIQNYLRYKPTDVKKTVTIPYLADYEFNTTETFPYAYFIAVPDKAVLSNLKTHGIKIEKLTEAQSFEVERFDIKELKGSQRLNQGHYTNTVDGTWVNENKTFEAGTWVVRTSQKLANVIVYLLEPKSGDGLLHWNYFDKYLVPQWGRGYYPYPVYRLKQKTNIKATAL